MPSASYIPQRKLFDNKRGSYGLFNSIGDIRQWATETDARTNVYGNINVQYTNQYGSTQCMSFPVEIEDIWRMGESIDSAINWGDPDASPSECVNKDALNLVKYWETKAGTGVVPDSEFASGTAKHIAQPPALKIGPAPRTSNQNYYPGNNSYEYYFYQQNANSQDKKNEKQTATKNCGMLDSITDIKEANMTVNGIKITIESTSSGSLTKNKYGSNLMVEIDKKGMTGNCVYIKAPITAKVKRAISFESEQVAWVLEVLVKRDDWVVPTDFDYKNPESIKKYCEVSIATEERCKQLAREYKARNPTATDQNVFDEVVKANPECLKYLSPANIGAIIAGAVAEQKCTKKASEYGFQYIDKMTKLTNAELDDSEYCSKYFCNNDQLQAFLLNKFIAIKEKVTTLGNNCATGVQKLSELYKMAPRYDMNLCDEKQTKKQYYAGNSGLITDNYSIPLTDTSRVTNVKAANSSGNAVPINDMATILKAIPSSEKDKLLIKIVGTAPAELTPAVAKALGIVNASDANYMPLTYYIALNETVGGSAFTNCNQAGTPCTVDLTCTGSDAISLSPKVVEWMAKGSTIVKGIMVGAEGSDVEKIYANNQNLRDVHSLAVFDSSAKAINSSAGNSLLLTKMTFAKLDIGIADKINPVRDTTIAFINNTSKLASAEVGKYRMELDYNICDDGKDVNMMIKEGPMKIDDATRASSNIFLTTGYAIATKGASLENTTNNVLIDGAVLYPRNPFKMSATLFGGESGLGYRVVASQGVAAPTTSDTLINWHEDAVKRTDAKQGNVFKVSVPTLQSAKTLTGIYYYTTGGELIFSKAIIGGRVSATNVLSKAAVSEVTLSTTQESNIMQFGGAISTPLTLEEVLSKLKNGTDGYICAEDNKVIWNETELLKQN